MKIRKTCTKTASDLSALESLVKGFVGSVSYILPYKPFIFETPPMHWQRGSVGKWGSAKSKYSDGS